MKDKTIKQRLSDAGVWRMRGWAIAAALSMAIVAWRAPQQIDVLIVKANLLSIAAWGGYWIDRSAFDHGRPHQFDPESEAFRTICLRRAIVIGATMLAFSLAL